jgi:hypothetical protein
MLQTIKQLGEVSSNEVIETRTFDRVIVMKFVKNEKGKLVYDRSESRDYLNWSKYYWERDMSGNGAGLFLTGNIPSNDIKKLPKDREVFINNKIMWFPHGKFIKNIDRLSKKRRGQLLAVFKEMNKKRNRIANDVITPLEEQEKPQTTLLTVLINGKYMGDIKGFVNFYNTCLLDSKGNESDQLLVCCVCNKEKMIHSYSIPPITWFYSDDIHFFDNYDKMSIAKALPICTDCYPSIRQGVRFVKGKMNYDINAEKYNPVKGKLSVSDADMSFLLLPTLSDYRHLMQFRKNLEDSKKVYYLSSLRGLCSSLETLQEVAWEHEDDYAESYLRFAALFYNSDKNGHMKVFNVVNDIYPPVLRNLLKVKYRLDNLYPFKNIVDEDKKYVFGIPLVVLFSSNLLEILNEMFTDRKISMEQTFKNVNTLVKKVSRSSNDMDVITKVVFDGLLFLQYINHLNNPHLRSPPQVTVMENRKISYEKAVERFIQNHESLMTDENERGSFATVVIAATLIYTQEDRTGKSAHFWGEIHFTTNDLDRIMTIPPKVLEKLAQYNVRDHDELIDSLISNYPINHNKEIPRDRVNYFFTLGICFGRKLLRTEIKEEQEEVIEA